MTVITTPRLKLERLSPAIITSTAHENQELTKVLLGRPVPEDWFDEAWVFAQRQQQIATTPAFSNWAMWAIITSHDNQLIGCLNCHHMPLPFKLENETHLATEIGYTISPPYRRQGYGKEAVKAFQLWAKTQGVGGLILTIAPNNTPSLSLSQSLGAQLLGEQLDDENQPQLIFHLS